jgi:flagellar basal body-associated protein FliL
VRDETRANLWQAKHEMTIRKATWKEFIREDYKFFIIFIMLGVIMYWTAVVIQPTYEILQLQQERQEDAAKNLEIVIDNAEENTGELKTNQELALQVLNNTVKLSTQNDAQFEATLSHVDEQLNNQTDYLEAAISQNKLNIDSILGNITTLRTHLDSIAANISHINQMLNERSFRLIG